MSESDPLESLKILPPVLKWLGISILIGLLAGTASAAFLWSLDFVTAFREQRHWLILFLPAAGLLIGLAYHRFGQKVEAGSNLLIDEIHDPKNVVPLRMAPLILVGTLVTHLFGGSAGREGTAVQMGAALADQLTNPFRLSADDRRLLLMAGISAGFASIFGTPLAGAIFGLEVLAVGRLRYEAILPCFFSAILADQVTLAWGIHHTQYVIPFFPGLTPLHLLSAAAAGVIFGFTGMFFASATRKIYDFFKRIIPYPPFRPLLGGGLIALAVFGLGTTRYIGLGIPVMRQAFAERLPPWDFVMKFIFTTVTLGSGFKGGEVTPLFYIGAALGNTLSCFLPLPMALLAGLGFVAVFAGAANTPLACTFMAVELFGTGAGIYAAIACVVSYLFSGHAGIYHSQRIEHRKMSRLRH